MYYIISEELHNQLESEFNKFGLSYEIENSEYRIDEKSLDRIIENGIEIDQFFMNNFHENAKTYLSEFIVYGFRIMSYVDDHFKDHPIENIDFKTHLPRNIAVVKCSRTFHENGKPDFVKYKIDDVYVAKRKWDFIVNDETGFPEDIKEFLAYYKDDGTLGEYFLIKHNSFDPMKDSDEIMTQLELPRKNIVKQLKGLVYKNLTVSDTNMSHENKLIISGNFFRDYASVLNLFIEIGIVQSDNPDDEFIINKILKDMIPDEDNNLKYPFLNHPFFMNSNYKLFQIVIGKLSY